jgi:Ca2+-binding EF-hand superfamily protein
MKLNNLHKSVIASSLIALMGSVQAMEINHKDVDLNQDGMVTEAEIINVIKTHFMKMDKDGDTQVTTDEWEDTLEN